MSQSGPVAVDSQAAVSWYFLENPANLCLLEPRHPCPTKSSRSWCRTVAESGGEDRLPTTRLWCVATERSPPAAPSREAERPAAAPRPHSRCQASNEFVLVELALGSRQRRSNRSVGFATDDGWTPRERV